MSMPFLFGENVAICCRLNGDSKSLFYVTIKVERGDNLCTLMKKKRL